jgi:2-polyprenyl-3-methyl-5-hydroxy-6-metoxy-1,4-benzoquinol methylase
MDERALDQHFAFGENWQSFLATVTPETITQAERSLSRLFPDGALRNKRVLDVGCGSGLSMLAALRLGAARVHGVDLDPRSVAAARALLGEHAPDQPWSLDVRSVFDLSPVTAGAPEAPATGALYDVVHSWGVLHHTGAMWDAMDRAVALVAPGGLLAIALYRRTPLCGFWKAEKRFYASAPPAAQSMVRALYKAAYAAGLLATGRNPVRYVREYTSARGMSWHHDVHDWLGGYPYESVTPAEVTVWLDTRGFDPVRVFERPAAAAGLFGTHCDEYVAVRRG